MIDNPLNKLHFKRGEDLPHSKLTAPDVKTIRALVAHRNALIEEARTLRNIDIADKFGVSVSTVNKVAMGETWGHIP